MRSCGLVGPWQLISSYMSLRPWELPSSKAPAALFSAPLRALLSSSACFFAARAALADAALACVASTTKSPSVPVLMLSPSSCAETLSGGLRANYWEHIHMARASPSARNREAMGGSRLGIELVAVRYGIVGEPSERVVSTLGCVPL